MGDDDDLSTAGRAGGVAGWHGGERRQGDRRSRSGSGGGDVTRGSDRRQSQFCHVCGNNFNQRPRKNVSAPRVVAARSAWANRRAAGVAFKIQSAGGKFSSTTKPCGPVTKICRNPAPGTVRRS